MEDFTDFFPDEDKFDILDEEDIDVLEDIEEEDRISSNEIVDKITLPIMSIYEKSKIISNRIKQLDQNFKTTMEEEVAKLKLTSSYDIAMLEFQNSKLPPYIIKRQFPNNTYELWRHEDFEIFP